MQWHLHHRSSCKNCIHFAIKVRTWQKHNKLQIDSVKQKVVHGNWQNYVPFDLVLSFFFLFVVAVNCRDMKKKFCLQNEFEFTDTIVDWPRISQKHFYTRTLKCKQCFILLINKQYFNENQFSRTHFSANEKLLNF